MCFLYLLYQKKLMFIQKFEIKDYLKWAPWALGVSAAVLIAGIFVFFTKGLNVGVDFKGGVLLEVRFVEAVDLEHIRNIFANDKNIIITTIGDSYKDIVIRASTIEDGKQEILHIQELLSGFETEIEEFRRIEFIGPVIGKELVNNGILAVVVSLFVIALYIWIRFEFPFAISALLTLMHDILIVMAVYVFTGIEFDLSSIAVVLTIAGYSINDTVVIFDRIRSSLKDLSNNKGGYTLKEIINNSLRSVFLRTIITSFTTLLALMSLLVFAGPALHGFAVVLFMGVIVGTYSSLFIASPFLSLFDSSSLYNEVEKDEDVVKNFQ